MVSWNLPSCDVTTGVLSGAWLEESGKMGPAGKVELRVLKGGFGMEGKDDETEPILLKEGGGLG